MSPEKAALIIASLGLATVLIWWVFKPRSGGRDVGLSVFHEDEMDDLEELYRLPAADREWLDVHRRDCLDERDGAE